MVVKNDCLNNYVRIKNINLYHVFLSIIELYFEY